MATMAWTLKHEREHPKGCRDTAKRSGGNLIAGIYNADGYGVASIDRLGRRIDGEVGFVHAGVEGNDEPDLHATTDDEWLEILDVIAAAPQMLAACKQMARAYGCGNAADEIDGLRALREAIAQAEANRRAKRTVEMKVMVEVEVAPGENAEHAAIARLRDGAPHLVTNVRVD
jgi:hypothetical protein